MKKFNPSNEGLLSFLFGMLVLLQLIDFISTYIGIERGLTERNALFIFASNWIGIIPAVFIAKLMAAGIYYLFYRDARSAGRHRSACFGFALAVLLYLYVVFSNFTMIGLL